METRYQTYIPQPKRTVIELPIRDGNLCINSSIACWKRVIELPIRDGNYKK